MGSTDIQVARLFQRRIALDTLAGGIVGTVVAAAIIALVGWRIAALGSDLLGGVALGAGDWIVLAALPFAFALLALGAAAVAVLVTLGTRLLSSDRAVFSSLPGLLVSRCSWSRCPCPP